MPSRRGVGIHGDRSFTPVAEEIVVDDGGDQVWVEQPDYVGGVRTQREAARRDALRVDHAQLGQPLQDTGLLED